MYKPITYGFESVSVLMKDLMKKPDPELDELSQDLKSKKPSWGVSFLYVEYRRKMGPSRMMTYIRSNHSEQNYL